MKMIVDFQRNDFAEYLSMASYYFCRIANLPHLFPIYFLHVIPHSLNSLATSNRKPPLHFPIENILENEYL